MAAQIALSVAGRTYEVSCDDGQQRKIAELAIEIDSRARQLRATVGPVSDALLLVMVALTLMDDLVETRSHVLPSGVAADADARLAAGLDRLTNRIESIADWVQKT
jgi:cell division protein ZapA